MQSVTTVDQRMREVAQTARRAIMHPRRMLLESRTLKRCSSCLTLLVKPDLPSEFSKATFSEINMSAMYVLNCRHVLR